MTTSIIKVYNTQLGQWDQNTKVVLGWDGFVNLGIEMYS